MSEAEKAATPATLVSPQVANGSSGLPFFGDITEHRDEIEASTEPRLENQFLLDERYLILELVGRSGMASIYRARDRLSSNREVAIKVPLLKVESNPVAYAMFRNEEKVGLSLSHPAVLKFFPGPQRKSRPYLVTEFLRGSALSHLIRPNLPLPEENALRLIALVCEAVAHMHERGFVHCDLKPENIMVCIDRSIRLMDFGLSSPPLRSKSVISKLNPVCGTPEYMAPEQVENGPIDGRTDIYSLGAMLYEMLTGKVPFQCEDAWKSAFQRTSGDPEALRTINPRVSPQAEEIVLHAMQRMPSDRYASIKDFQGELVRPETVVVSGYSDRLKPPRWKMSFQGTPILMGLVIGFGVLSGLITLFFALLPGPLVK